MDNLRINSIERLEEVLGENKNFLGEIKVRFKENESFRTIVNNKGLGECELIHAFVDGSFTNGEKFSFKYILEMNSADTGYNRGFAEYNLKWLKEEIKIIKNKYTPFDGAITGEITLETK